MGLPVTDVASEKPDYRYPCDEEGPTFSRWRWHPDFFVVDAGRGPPALSKVLGPRRGEAFALLVACGRDRGLADVQLT